jgi:hypothetical protein
MKEKSQLSLVTSEVKDGWLTISAPDMETLQIPSNPDPTNFKQTSVM